MGIDTYLNPFQTARGFTLLIGLAIVFQIGAGQTPSHPLSQITPTDSNLNFSNNDNTKGYNITNLPWLNPSGTTLNLGSNLDVRGNQFQNPSSIVNYFGGACPSGQAVRDVGDDGSLTCISISASTQDLYVNESGDTMGGNLSFDSSYWIKGLRDPVSSQDAMTLSYADTAFLRRDTSDSMLGNLDMAGNELLNVDALGNGTAHTIAMDSDGNVYIANGVLSLSTALADGNVSDAITIAASGTVDTGALSGTVTNKVDTGFFTTSTPLTAGNISDGPNSNLDADTLDGVELESIDWADVAMAQSDTDVSDINPADTTLDMSGFNLQNVDTIGNGSELVGFSSDLDLNQHRIRALENASASDDAITLSQGDARYLNTGSTDSIDGDLDMLGYNILNVDALGNGTVRTIQMDGNGNVEIPNGNLVMSAGIVANITDGSTDLIRLHSGGDVGIPDLLIGTGGATDPGLAFIPDGNEGIYRPGNDQIGLATAGSPALEIDSNQNVEIPNGDLNMSGNYINDVDVLTGSLVVEDGARWRDLLRGRKPTYNGTWDKTGNPALPDTNSRAETSNFGSAIEWSLSGHDDDRFSNTIEFLFQYGGGWYASDAGSGWTAALQVYRSDLNGGAGGWDTMYTFDNTDYDSWHRFTYEGSSTRSDHKKIRINITDAPTDYARFGYIQLYADTLGGGWTSQFETAKFGAFDKISIGTTNVTYGSTLSVDGDVQVSNGNLSMNNNFITSVSTATGQSQSLINVGDADTRYLQRSGDSMTGDLDLDGHNIVNVDALGNGTTRSIEIDGSGGVKIPNGDLNVSGDLTAFKGNQLIAQSGTESRRKSFVEHTGSDGRFATNWGGIELRTGDGTIPLFIENGADIRIQKGNIDVGSNSMSNITDGATNIVTFDGNQNVNFPNGDLDLNGNEVRDAISFERISNHDAEQGTVTFPYNDWADGWQFRDSHGPCGGAGGQSNAYHHEIKHNSGANNEEATTSDGDYYFILGGRNASDSDIDTATNGDYTGELVSRPFHVPSNAKIRAKVRPYEGGGMSPHEGWYVQVANVSDDLVLSEANVTWCGGAPNSWQDITLDLSGYAGETVEFRFGIDGNDGDQDGASMQVDDITLIPGIHVDSLNQLHVSDGITLEHGNFNMNGTAIDTGGGTIEINDSTNNQDIARFNEGGNVEIPNGNLEVDRTGDNEHAIFRLNSDFDSSYNPSLEFRTGGKLAGYIHYDNSSQRIDLNVHGSDAIRADGSQDVNIPNGELQVTNDGGFRSEGTTASSAYLHDVTDGSDTTVMQFLNQGNEEFQLTHFISQNQLTFEQLEDPGDTANRQELLRLNQGGTVEVPNGNLNVSNNVHLMDDQELRFGTNKDSAIFFESSSGTLAFGQPGDSEWTLSASGTLKSDSGNSDLDLNENLIKNVNALQDGSGTNTISFDGSNNVNIPNGNLKMNHNSLHNSIISPFNWISGLTNGTGGRSGDVPIIGQFNNYFVALDQREDVEISPACSPGSVSDIFDVDWQSSCRFNDADLPVTLTINFSSKGNVGSFSNDLDKLLLYFVYNRVVSNVTVKRLHTGGVNRSTATCTDGDEEWKQIYQNTNWDSTAEVIDVPTDDHTCAYEIVLDGNSNVANDIRLSSVNMYLSGDRGDWMGGYIKRTGDTMYGNFDLNGNLIQNVDALGNGTTRTIQMDGNGNVEIPNGNLDIDEDDEQAINLHSDTLDSPIGISIGAGRTQHWSIGMGLDTGSARTLEIRESSTGESVDKRPGFRFSNAPVFMLTEGTNEDRTSIYLDSGNSRASLRYNGSAYLYGNSNGNVNVPNGNLDVSGDCTEVDGACADIAELYNASEPVEAADIVMVDTDKAEHVEKAEKAEREHQIGVVTTAPAILFKEDQQLIGKGLNYSVNPMKPGVALVGRVPIKVNMENGPIQIGDPITVSREEGVGMKAETSGMVVGTALELYNESSSDGKITVFVNPRYHVPQGTIQEIKEENQQLKAAVCEVNPNATICS